MTTALPSYTTSRDVTRRYGHTMPIDAFERGLVNGWFGIPRMAPKTARSLIEELQLARDMPESSEAVLRLVKANLMSGRTPQPLSRRVNWYFFDRKALDDPFLSIGPDIAYRLALPCVFDRDTSVELIAFRILSNGISEPRVPRFTDNGGIDGLEIWRPGGKTAPWVKGLAGLEEIVATPCRLGDWLDDVRIVDCPLM